MKLTKELPQEKKVNVGVVAFETNIIKYGLKLLKKEEE